jgi:hypothetical protein
VCKPKKSSGALTVIDPLGIHLKIPGWMVSPQASGYKLSARAMISIEALFFLADLLESSINKESWDE